MINLLRKVRQQYINEGSYRLYILYAFGEVLLVMVGILLALQLDNLHQKSVQKQVQIENIENICFSFNERIQLGPLISMIEFALEGKELWIDYLEGKTPFHDSLLNYSYLIGSTHLSIPIQYMFQRFKVKTLF